MLPTHFRLPLRRDPYDALGYAVAAPPPKQVILATLPEVAVEDTQCVATLCGTAAPAAAAALRAPCPLSFPDEDVLRAVELCIGQLPLWLPAGGVAAIVASVEPSAIIIRCVAQQPRAPGVAFVTLRDNGAAQSLLLALHERAWFTPDGNLLLAASCERAAELEHRRRIGADGTARGDMVPMRAVTVQWSRSPLNRRFLLAPGPSCCDGGRRAAGHAMQNRLQPRLSTQRSVAPGVSLTTQLSRDFHAATHDVLVVRCTR